MHWKEWFSTVHRQPETVLFVWKRLKQAVKQLGCRARMFIIQIALFSGCRLVTCVLFAAIICQLIYDLHQHQLAFLRIVHFYFIFIFIGNECTNKLNLQSMQENIAAGP
jgi:hypothetical protein